MPPQLFIMLDEKSAEPLYRQIYTEIRRAILVGELPSGRQLPASRLLAGQLGVARITVINAYDQLFAEGYLDSRRGAGTFVAKELPEEFLHPSKIELPTDAVETAPRDLKLSGYGKRLAQEKRAILRHNPVTRIIPFQHALTAIDEFPFDIWSKLTNKCYQTLAPDEFGYGNAGGFLPLREALAAHLKSARAVNCKPEQIIITNGAQQAFDFIGRLLLEPQAEIWIENPCYLGAKQVFESAGAKLVPVMVDDQGFDVQEALKQSSQARLACVTPSHQFPLGVTMSLSRRLQLLEWAKNAGGWIVEDDYDSEYRYGGRPLASLQGLDREGRVLYIGSFSKTIFPALRLGCLVVPPDLIEIFSAMRALSGSPSPLIEQATLTAFIAEGHFARHMRRMRRLYEERQTILVAEIKKHLTGVLEINKSTSGMHLIGWLNEGVSDYAVAKKALEFGIKLVPVSSHSLTKWERGGLILGYAALNEKQIKQGVKQLAKIIQSVTG